MQFKDIGNAYSGSVELVMMPQVGREEMAKVIGYRTNAGVPSAVVPNFIGEKLFDTTNKAFYVAYGVAAGNYKQATVSEAGVFTIEALDMASATPATHPINMEGLTLPADSNAIRGVSVNPTRTSGWTSFSGTVADAPAQVYTDYRELHTTGTAEILGAGAFPYMDATASCQSMFCGQDIAYVSAGATVESAAGAPGVGIFGRAIKTVLDGETFTAGGVAAAIFLSVQANVTDVQAEDTSIVNAEVASGGIENIIKMQCSAAKGATYLLNLTDDNGEPASVTNGTTLADISATANAGWIRVKIGTEVRYIPLYEVKAA